MRTLAADPDPVLQGWSSVSEMYGRDCMKGKTVGSLDLRSPCKPSESEVLQRSPWSRLRIWCCAGHDTDPGGLVHARHI